MSSIDEDEGAENTCAQSSCFSFSRGRYKQDLTPDQKAALLDLIRVQKHAGISPEISRELISGKARGEILDEPIDEDDDDVMSL